MWASFVNKNNLASALDRIKPKEKTKAQVMAFALLERSIGGDKKLGDMLKSLSHLIDDDDDDDMFTQVFKQVAEYLKSFVPTRVSDHPTSEPTGVSAETVATASSLHTADVNAVPVGPPSSAQYEQAGAELPPAATPVGPPVGKLTMALAQLFTLPEWSNRQIANAVGCSAAYLSQNQKWRRARKGIKGVGQEDKPRAHHHLGNDMDQYQSDAENE